MCRRQDEEKLADGNGCVRNKKKIKNCIIENDGYMGIL